MRVWDSFVTATSYGFLATVAFVVLVTACAIAYSMYSLWAMSPWTTSSVVLAVVLFVRSRWVPSRKTEAEISAFEVEQKPRENIKEGETLVMGFRRQRFTWTSAHIPKQTIDTWEHRADASDSLFHLGMTPAAYREALLEARFVDMPAWIDWALLEQGCQFFVQAWPFVLFSFGWALFGGFGAETASAVLLQSRYWASEGDQGRLDTWRRLRETACWLHDVAAHGAEGFQQGGVSWTACLHVRYLHSRIRATLNASGKWDVERRGVPVNQAQLIGTLLGSSVLLLQGMEELLSCKLPAQNKEAFTHLWRVIGFLFGIDEDLNPNRSFDEATVVMESVFYAAIPFFPDPALAGKLTKHICDSVVVGIRAEYGKAVSPGLVAVPAWHFLGEEYGRAIGLPEASVSARALGVARMAVLRIMLFVYCFLPGAPIVFDFVMRRLFDAMVRSIHRDQPACRFGVIACPFKGGAKKGEEGSLVDAGGTKCA